MRNVRPARDKAASITRDAEDMQRRERPGRDEAGEPQASSGRAPLQLSRELRELTSKQRGSPIRRSWSLMKSRGRLLLLLQAHPDARIVQIAEALGLTERRVMQMVRELKTSGMLTVAKAGRRNSYQVKFDEG